MSIAQTGRVLAGRYRLMDQLGRGGLGRVWKAYDQRLDVHVAIKEVVLPPDATEDGDILTRADREARNAARLRDHPDIVTVHDVIVEADRPWMVLQLVEGRSLADLLRERGSLPVEEVARIGAAVLRALDAAHRVGVIHRDIKPANILLSDRGEVLLADFGIAIHHTDAPLTQTGMLIGSMEYLAPERARGEDATAASDLFSLGATLHYAITGTSPFSRSEMSATLSAVLFDEVEVPAQAGRLAPLIRQLLDKDPAKRPSCAQALAVTPPTAKSSVPTSPLRWRSVAGLAVAAAMTIPPLFTVPALAAPGIGTEATLCALALAVFTIAIAHFVGTRAMRSLTSKRLLWALPVAATLGSWCLAVAAVATL